ncbi:Panacea domain-containing protein [Methanobrevibacter cuticularis]|nr:Panacea domain-containing protein [Methanobrevibacter cuticularis]
MNECNEKIKQLMHYIIDKCNNKKTFGTTVLYKLMYFSDFNHYEKYETQITEETYLKYPHGPVPSNLDHFCNELEKEGKIELHKIPHNGNMTQHRRISLSNPDTSLLSTKEIETIDTVIEELGDMTSTKIEEYSHKDKPWRVAQFREPLDPEFVFYRDDEYSVREYDD